MNIRPIPKRGRQYLRFHVYAQGLKSAEESFSILKVMITDRFHTPMLPHTVSALAHPDKKYPLPDLPWSLPDFLVRARALPPIF